MMKKADQQIEEDKNRRDPHVFLDIYSLARGGGLLPLNGMKY